MVLNPKSHQWSLNFANANDGTLTQPTVGEFKNGRGEFFAFSDDGGKTWEVNRIATDTRVKDGP